MEDRVKQAMVTIDPPSLPQKMPVENIVGKGENAKKFKKPDSMSYVLYPFKEKSHKLSHNEIFFCKCFQHDNVQPFTWYANFRLFQFSSK